MNTKEERGEAERKKSILFGLFNRCHSVNLVEQRGAQIVEARFSPVVHGWPIKRDESLPNRPIKRIGILEIAPVGDTEWRRLSANETRR